jgi:hypothetical protein
MLTQTTDDTLSYLLVSWVQLLQDKICCSENCLQAIELEKLKARVSLEFVMEDTSKQHLMQLELVNNLEADGKLRSK